MQAETTYQALSPQRGWLQQCEQNFCEGAKGLNSQHSAFSTPPSDSVFSEIPSDFTEIHDSLGCGALEAFIDVILSDDEFDAKFEQDFHKDIEVSKFAHDFNAVHEIDGSSDLPQMQNEVLEVPTSGLILKLKKVKCKRKNPNKPFTIFRVGTEDPVDIFNIVRPDYKSLKTNEVLSESSFPSFFDSDIVPELDFPFDIDNVAPNNTPLTLKEVINMKDADIILADYLDGEGNSPSGTTHEVSGSPIWEDVQSRSLYDTSFSDLSSFEDASSLLSNLEDYPTSFLPVSPGLVYTSPNDSPPSYTSETPLLSPRNTPTKRSRLKPKKGRQKMSTESRYLRKKEQNKQAALRYRAKKKQENEETLNTLKMEENRREELEDKRTKLKQEVAFIKQLMREICISKGLASPNAFD